MNTVKNISQLLNLAINFPNKNHIFILEKIFDVDIIFKRTGLNLIGYSRIIDTSSIRHVLLKHTKDGIIKINEISITEMDFDLISMIAKPNNIIGVNPDRKGTVCIQYRKKINNIYTYVEEVRTKHKFLCLKTMYKTKPILKSIG